MPAASPRSCSVIMIGQYPIGTSSRLAKASTVAFMSQIGARSRVACFCRAALTRDRPEKDILSVSDTSASWRISIGPPWNVGAGSDLRDEPASPYLLNGLFLKTFQVARTGSRDVFNEVSRAPALSTGSARFQRA